MDNNSTVCSKCNKATVGKVYNGWCADCKITDLEEAVDFYKEQYEHADKKKSEWMKKQTEDSIEKTKYRHAFEVLFEAVTKK